MNHLGGESDPWRSRPVASGGCDDEGVVVFNKLIENATSAAQETDAKVLVNHIHQQGAGRL